MKILHVTPYYEPDFNFGGIVSAVGSLCRKLVELGHEVTVYTTQDPNKKPRKPLHHEIFIGGVRVIYFRNLMKGFAFSPGLLSASKDVNQFDIVHTAAFWQFFSHPSMFYALKENTALVLSPHGCFSQLVNPSLNAFKNRLFYWTFNHRIIQRMSALHFTAEVERDDVIPLKLKVPSFRVANPLNWREFEHLPERSESRKELDLNENDQVILFLGRLGWRKALDILVRAFAQMSETRKNAVLILSGPDFGEEQNLRALVDEFGLNDRVRFTGMVDAEGRAKLLSAADMCALTAHRGENFGIAAAEAMASGIPVIVSDVSGISHDVADYDAGIVVPVNEERIAQGLLEMLSNKEKLRKMGEAGRRMVKEIYDEQKIAALMASAYQDILSGERTKECYWK